MTKDYSAYRKQALKWIDNEKRTFKEGLTILQAYGYKPVAVGNVARRGENNDFAKRKLIALMYEFIRLWHRPSMEDQDEKPELEVKEDPAPLAEKEINDLCDEQGYPEIMRRVIHEFYALLEERRKLHAAAAAIEGNDSESVSKRKDLLDTVESISERMDYLWAIKSKFEQDKIVPGEDLFEVKKEDSPADQDDKENDTIPEGASVDDLKTLKKNTNTKLIRARNMLDYQQTTKAETTNPMPEGPKRVKYEKKVEALTAFIKDIDYKIVELS